MNAVTTRHTSLIEDEAEGDGWCRRTDRQSGHLPQSLCAFFSSFFCLVFVFSKIVLKIMKTLWFYGMIQPKNMFQNVIFTFLKR